MREKAYESPLLFEKEVEADALADASNKPGISKLASNLTSVANSEVAKIMNMRPYT